MSLLLQLLILLALLIILAKAAGWLSARLGQPAVLGELLVGLILGPSVLNLFQRRVERWPVSAAVPAVALVATFFIAWAAEFIGGVAAITGAFLVGLGLRRSSQHHAIVEAIHTMGYALFVPLFFVSVGLQANVRALDGQLLLFAGALILVAVVTKVVGSGLGALLGGFKPREAFRVGLGMVSRGEVGLIVAAVEIREGWLDESLFAVVMLLILVSTIITPLMLKLAFQSGKKQRGAQGTSCQ